MEPVVDVSLVAAGQKRLVWFLRASHLGCVMWVQQHELVIIGNGQAACKLLNIVIKLIQDESSPLLRNLQDHALRFLNVESSDKHAGLARADLDYKIATPHPFALFVQNDAILVQDAGLAIDYRSRL